MTSGARDEGPDDDENVWTPEVGDRLIGDVVEIRERVTPFGSYPVVTIQPAKGGPVAVHAFHTILEVKLDRLGPEIGETIGVMYSGRYTVDPGFAYHNYHVARGSFEDPDWL